MMIVDTLHIKIKKKVTSLVKHQKTLKITEKFLMILDFFLSS